MDSFTHSGKTAQVNELKGKLLTSMGLHQRVNDPSFTSVETNKKVKEPFLVSLGQ